MSSQVVCAPVIMNAQELDLLGLLKAEQHYYAVLEDKQDDNYDEQ
jgi:heat shock protein HslJ